MFIHNRKKKFALSVINVFIELVFLPKRLFSKKVDIRKFTPSKILLVRLDHIGDVVMTSPSFTLLRSVFPETEILLLTNNAGLQLFSDDYRIDKVIVFKWPWGQQKTKERFSVSRVKELLRLISELRKEKIDVCIDFRGDIRFILLFGLLSGARFNISNSRSGKSSLLDYISDYDVSKHEVERSLDVIKCFAGPAVLPRPKILIREEEVSSIRLFVENVTASPLPARIAVIAPYSSRDVKSWPDNYFKEVIEHLESAGFTVFIVGGNEDSENAEKLIEELGNNVFSLAGKTSIRQLAALISVSGIVVGVDTGVLHLASCFDLPIIAIFGSTRAIEFRPYSPYTIIVESRTCMCNQFLHLKCDHAVNGYSKCMYQLPPASVITAIDSVIKV